MGRSKPLIAFGDKTLLELALENVRNSCVEEIVVVLGFNADEIRRRTVLNGCKVVVNDAFRDGMAGSIRVGFVSLQPQADAALMVLADQPFVKPATIDVLISQYRISPAKIFLPVYQGRRGNPVLIDRSLFDEADKLRGDAGFRELFSKHREDIQLVDVADAGVLVDLDTKDDLKQILNDAQH